MMQSKYIGITGSISTGKSTVTEYLLSKGYKVVDADKIAREVYDSKEVFEKTVDAFGKDILKDGKIDRIKLGKKVFGDKEALDTLNKIVHPQILLNLKREALSYDKDVVFLDIPLLIEMIDDIKNIIDLAEVWVVYIPEELQIKRLMARDNISKEMALKKISSQISIEDKKALADVVIENTGTLSDLYERVDKELRRLKIKGQD